MPQIRPNQRPSFTTDPSQMNVYNPSFVPTGLDGTAAPQTPGYNPIYDPLSMSITPELQQQLQGINLNTEGLDAFRQQALRKGPSSWAQLAQQDQLAQASNAREQGAKQTNAQTAQADDNLAATGGLSSGARERTAQEGAKNYMAMSQDLTRQSNLNDMQIGMNDEQNRIQQLGMLPGMEVQSLQPELQKASMWEGAKANDVSNQMQALQSTNDWNKYLYGQQMSGWAAQQQGYATEHSGKKG